MLKQRILETLRFFALQEIGATLFEIHTFLVAPSDAVHLSATGELVVPVDLEFVSLYEVSLAVDELVTEREVVQVSGYYALAGHEMYITARWRGYYFGIQRERRIARFARMLQYIPFIDGVALAGSQALGHERAGSDIDLLIFTKNPYIWLPRTLVTAYFQIFGIRRHGALITNRFCLNHYISHPKTIKAGRNWYTAFEYSKLRPLVGEYVVRAFQSENLDWLKTFFPNVQFAVDMTIRRSVLQSFLEKIINASVGQFIEQRLGAWQVKRIRLNDPHTLALSDELFFSPHSKEDKILEGFLKLKQ